MSQSEIEIGQNKRHNKLLDVVFKSFIWTSLVRLRLDGLALKCGDTLSLSFILLFM